MVREQRAQLPRATEIANGQRSRIARARPPLQLSSANGLQVPTGRHRRAGVRVGAGFRGRGRHRQALARLQFGADVRRARPQPSDGHRRDREACDTLIHAHSSYFNVQEIRLAERLARVMPQGLEKSLFLQSGSDANDAAIMIARQYTGGYEVASPHISFHGMSDTARSLTFAGWHQGHGTLPAGSYAIVAPYCYR